MGIRSRYGKARTRKRRLTGAALAGLFLSALCPALAQQSSRFVMDRVTVAAVTGAAASARFSTTAVVAQSPFAGAASRCNHGFVSGFGFWSVSGSVSVPILLQLAIDQAEPETLDLLWTGADPRFRLFRSHTAQDVTDPANLAAETPFCAHVEIEAPDIGVVFYRVLAAPDP